MEEYFSFAGRVTRKKFWIDWVLKIFVVSLYLELIYIFLMKNVIVINEMLPGSYFQFPSPSYRALAIALTVIMNIFNLLVTVSGISYQVRRLHDIGKSGWYVLVSLIPIVGWIWQIILMCTESDPQENEYGKYMPDVTYTKSTYFFLGSTMVIPVILITILISFIMNNI